MDPPDDDIQFDFFADEPATTESASSRVRLPRRGGSGTGGRRRAPAGPPRGLTPVVRLLAAAGILVLLLVLFGLLLQSCGSTSKHDSYQSYMEKVALIGHSSADDGTALANALTTPGAKVDGLASTLDGIAAREQQNVNAAERLDPPGPLRPVNQPLIEALELRVSGVQGLASAFRATATSKSSGAASTLSAQADRLLASDIVWDDLFVGPAKAIMKKEGVTGVSPPESHFVTNPDLISAHSMALVLQRLRGTTSSSTPTGLHGTNIVATKVLPSGQDLSETDVNTITAGTNLAFAVEVHDGGDSQEVRIKVTLTIQQTPVITKTMTIDLINPGQDKTVTFSDLGTVKFAQKEQIDVDVAPVPGEHDIDNNKASYPVIFSLG